MFGGLLLLAIVVAALALMIGRIDLARNLGSTVFLMAIVAPLLHRCTVTVGQAVPSYYPTAAVVALISVGLILGFKKFVDHRREVHHWVGEPRSSIKLRVEDDL